MKLLFFGIDEAFHLWFASRPNLSELFSALRAAAPQQFPLDYLLNFSLFHLTQDLTKLRLVSVFWGVASVVVFYFLGRLSWNRTFGAVCAWLLAISLFHLQYSQMFKPYALIVLLGLISTVCFLKALESRKWVWFYAVSIFLYQMVYPFAVVMLVLNVAWAWIRKNENRVQLLYSLVLPGLFLAAWGILNGDTLFRSTPFAYAGSETLGWDGVKRILFSFSQFTIPSVLLYGLLACCGVIALGRSETHRKKLIYVFALMSGTLIAVWVSFHRANLFFHQRHVIALLPVFLALVAAGVVSIGILFRKRVAFPPIISIGICMAVPLLLLPTYRSYLKGQHQVTTLFNDGADFLKANAANGDVILTSNPNMGGTFLYYLDRDAFFNIKDLYVYEGANLFLFPPEFNASVGAAQVQIYALCSIDKASATLNREVFAGIVASTRKTGGRIWCVYNGANYVTEPNPFFPALGLKPDQLELKVPGIYLLKM